MKIIFDNQIFSKQNYGGISRYFASIISNFVNSKSLELYPKKFYSKNVHLVENNLTYYNALSRSKTFRGKSRFENYLYKKQEEGIKDSLRRGNFDVFHPTYYDTSFLKDIKCDKPFVLTIHDMIHELYYDPKYNKIHEETANKKILIPLASHIIAVSEYTKRDILKLYPSLNNEKISVIHHGTTLFREDHRLMNSTFSTKNFILFVGARNDYKNFDWFAKAIIEFLRREKLSLYCAGGGDFTFSEIRLLKDIEAEDFIKYIPIDNDLILKDLYSNSKCFVFPSLYEGFGIPILEAFECNCPVLLSKSSCFTEIAEDGAFYYEENNQSDLHNKLEIIIKDNQKVSEILKKSKQRLGFFSWNRATNQYKEIYKKVLSL